MQVESIIEKAKKLGLDVSGVSQNDILHHIAKQVGVDDLFSLEETLDSMLNENNSNDNELLNDNIENLEDTNNEVRNKKFGQKEYDQAKNENGVYDKNHYKSKQKELDEKLEDAKHEKRLTNKKVGVDENGHNKYKNKNVIDKVNDRRNVAKARQDAITNKLNNAKASAYNMMHPGEALKDKAKSTASNAAKNVGKKAAKGAAQAGKAVGKAAGKAVAAYGKAIITFLASNPILLAIVIGAIFLILLILLLFAGSSSGNDNKYSSVCESISLNVTSLSKSEFVSKVEEYFAGSTSSTAQNFVDNADSIYDIAKNNNINPELVVVRAILEGFSPGGSTYNYWGLSCYNTDSSACSSYATFDDGVLAYVSNISQYDSVSSMLSKYAYIGSYWYNPGGSGVGGCYYYEYIKEFMSDSRSEEVAEACSGSICTTAGEGNCLATTDEDQQAYTKWQVKRMADVRKTVFGVEPDSCTYTGDCVIYAQGDSNWGSIHLGSSNATMADSGCAVTSIAIGISCSGAELAVENFDAGVFIETLNNGNCFTSGGAIYWGCTAMQEILPSINLINSYDTSYYSEAEKNELINSFSPNNHFIILHFQNSSHQRGHYVVYTETSGEYYITKDPAGGKITNQLISEIDQIVVYSF